MCSYACIRYTQIHKYAHTRLKHHYTFDLFLTPTNKKPVRIVSTTLNSYVCARTIVLVDLIM